ncbi:MAG: hypothetical protein JW808_01055 [Victivallales bacterium]|nr:hypothetical protein [Victivallales bacterium]
MFLRYVLLTSLVVLAAVAGVGVLDFGRATLESEPLVFTPSDLVGDTGGPAWVCLTDAVVVYPAGLSQSLQMEDSSGSDMWHYCPVLSCSDLLALPPAAKRDLDSISPALLPETIGTVVAASHVILKIDARQPRIVNWAKRGSLENVDTEQEVLTGLVRGPVPEWLRKEYLERAGREPSDNAVLLWLVEPLPIWVPLTYIALPTLLFVGIAMIWRRIGFVPHGCEAKKETLWAVLLICLGLTTVACSLSYIFRVG